MMALKDIHHVVVGGGKDLVCHWPRMGGIWRWGDEMLVGYIEAPCEYIDRHEVSHALDGIWARAYMRLRRSQDGGLTWADGGKVFDNSVSVEEQRRTLRLDDYHEHQGPPREAIDMSSDDSILIMGRAWCGDEHTAPDGTSHRDQVCYCFRSTDRGRSWEQVPSIIRPEHTPTVFEMGNNYMKRGGSSLLCWMSGQEGVDAETGVEGAFIPQLYASEDNGVIWKLCGEVWNDPSGWISASYPHIVVLPSGRWLCFLGCWYRSGNAFTRWTSLCHSDDQGLNWSQPRKIQAWSISPFPVLLNDGRIVVVYTRRSPDPTGLYAIVSEDEGAHWSEPVTIRDDTVAAGPLWSVDGGYAVAVQMADGRIFAVYYWQNDDPDVPWHGGRKFIGGTFFRLD